MISGCLALFPVGIWRPQRVSAQPAARSVSQRAACRKRWLPEGIGCGFIFHFPRTLHPNSRRFLALLLHGLRAQVLCRTQRRQTGLPSAPGSGP